LESHFTDEEAGLLRAELYRRLRRHWHFVNELKMFDVHHLVQYGITVHGSPQEEPSFLQACWLYHPDTVERSFDHNGEGAEPGLKNPAGRWDLRPHSGRITRVTRKTLTSWRDMLEHEDVPVERTRALFAVNASTASVLSKLARTDRLRSLDLQFSRGWNETTDRRNGYFESAWGAPGTWDDVILQGPHLFVSTPLYKTPNKTMLHNQDWSATDFETLAPDVVPETSYKPMGDRYRYDCDYTDWGDDARPLPARDFYRVAWRASAANTGERTRIPALIPPGAAHINGVFSVGLPLSPLHHIVIVTGFASSLLADFMVRVAPKSGIYQGVFERLPVALEHPTMPDIIDRTLRLNCVTSAYGDMWRQITGEPWSVMSPTRRAVDRRQMLIELDALVAIALEVTADELCAVYRTQFSVLHGYDRSVYFFDSNGRLVPNSVLTVWRSKGNRVTETERTATNAAGNTYTYELPFVTLDREADIRTAHAHFSQLLEERS
jgi:hypothetical protein